jgi:hypothetical protein
MKSKYPGIYDSIESGVLGKIIATKYPGIYDQFITPGTQKEEAQGEAGIKGFGLGAVKGALNTAKTTSGLIKKLGAYVPEPVKKVFENTPVGLASRATAKVGDKLSQYDFKPLGTAEKIGFGTEQAAEFLIPGGAISKAGKAAEAGVDALKFGNLATKTLKVGAKVAIGAGEAAGVTALQGGSKKDVKTAAVLGGSLSLVAQGLQKVIQKLPETALTQILKRTPAQVAKNPNLPAQAAETGLTGISRQAIANNAEKAIQSIEVSLDDLLSKSTGKVSTAKVAGYLNDLRGAYANIPGEEGSVEIIDKIANQLFQGFKEGRSLTVLEANQLKRDIYQVISKSYGKGVFELPAKTEAQKLVASGLKKEIEKVIPEAKTLNQKQAVYIQIKKVLDKTIARTEGKGIAGTGIGIHDLLLGGIGTGAGALTGNPLLGLGAVAVKKGAESAAVLSATSKLITYFNALSPTKKLLFYQAIKGLTVSSSASQRTAK